MPKPIDFSFELVNAPIDYFKLLPEYFPAPFEFRKEEVYLPSKAPFVTKEHLKGLNLFEGIETIIFNFQVGKGKTKLSYELIKEYYDKGYYVIVASPFLKLVNKDRDTIVESFKLFDVLTTKIRKHSVFYGEDLSAYDEVNDDIYAYSAPVKKRIHIMTINRLLGNAGDDTLEQNYYKRLYLDNLLKATKGKKVVLFLDEVHESIHNFRSNKVPNLLRWKDRVEKVFISSATFTPSTLPLIKAVSLLTDKKVKVYELPRTKNKTQAKISLHILDEPYHSKKSDFLGLIRNRIRYYNGYERPVNVLTSTKALAEQLAQFCFSKDNIIIDQTKAPISISLDYVNLLTTKTTVAFNPRKNNIGTLFKTGVNIENGNDVLFIIFPAITNQVKFQNYGIFTDGVSSIIQSIGRLRKGGEIHLFIYDPLLLLGIKEHYPEILGENKFQPYTEQNKAYNLILYRYNKLLTSLKSEVLLMESGINKKRTMSYKNDFALWFPNEHEYLLNNSRSILLSSKDHSFGRKVSPYIFWACIYNQFANGTLKEIKYYTYKEPFLLTEKNAYKKFQNVLASKLEIVKKSSFRDALNDITELLTSIVHEKEEASIQYQIEKGKPLSISTILSRNPGIARQAYRAFFKVYYDVDLDFNNKERYLMHCIAESKTSTKSVASTLYKDLGILVELFSVWYDKQKIIEGVKQYIPYKIYEKIPDQLVIDLQAKFKEIRDNDLIIKHKAISLLQHLDSAKLDDAKKMLCKELQEWFYKVSKTPKGREKKKRFEIKPKSFTCFSCKML